MVQLELPIHPAILTSYSPDSYTPPIENVSPRKAGHARRVAKMVEQDAAIFDLVVGEMSYADVAHKYGATPRAVKDWVTARNARKSAEEMMLAAGATARKRVGAKVIAALAQGLTMTQVAKKYRLPIKTIQNISATKEFKGRELRRIEAYVSSTPIGAGEGAGGRMSDIAVRKATRRLGDKIRALQAKLNMPTFDYACTKQLALPFLEV